MITNIADTQLLNLKPDFRAEEQAQSTAAPEDELKMKALPEALPLDSAVTGDEQTQNARERDVKRHDLKSDCYWQ